MMISKDGFSWVWMGNCPMTGRPASDDNLLRHMLKVPPRFAFVVTDLGGEAGGKIACYERLLEQVVQDLGHLGRMTLGASINVLKTS